jgi:hypothetical protein
MTDLDHEVKVFVGDHGAEPLLVDVSLLLKVADLPAAIDAAQIIKVEDFPKEIIEDCREVEISSKALDGLSDLLPAIAADDSRGCLKCVFVNRKKKEAVATDGHVLLMKKLITAPKESFMIDATSLKIANCFSGNVTGFTIRHREEVKGADRVVTTTAADFLTLSGDGWQLISRVPVASEYPMYWKAIPDRSKADVVIWDRGLIAEINSFLEKSKPLTNPKTRMIHLTAGEGVVKNDTLSYFRKTEFGRDILPLKSEQVIGLNCEILQTILKFVGGRSVSVSVGEKMIYAMVFQGENFLALLMPLRTGEYGDVGISREELLKNEDRGELKKAA